MEFLKIKLKTALTFCVVLYSLNSFSQDADVLVESFRKSYEYEYAGDFKKAADELKINYSEGSYEINIRLGWLQYYSGLFDESVAYYNKALSLKPYSEEAKFGLINPKAAQGKWIEVASLYEKILDINPANTTANYRLGLIYYGQKDYSKAAKYFEKVINLYPFNYESLLMLGWTNFFLGKTREAKILFYKVLMYKPGDESAIEGIVLIK